MLAYAAIPFSPDELNRALQLCNRSVSVDVAKLADRARGFGIADDPFPAVSFDDALSQLSDLLLPKDFWPSMLQFQDLILVPQLNIAEVPFPLLRGPGGSRLVDSTAFWIARNIRDIEPQDDEQKHGFRVSSWDAKAAFSFDAPLVVGNPAFGSSGNLYLPPLPGAESEARAVASIVHTVPLIGEDATKAIVAQRARSADFIYIATHGAALPGDPLSGFLALAGAPDPSGRWTAREIQTMNLRATDLAILSACQTGLGGVHAAGVIGVGRAFTLAGVPWVVMSLWNVDDKATANLIQDFVSEMAACKTLHACLPAEALRRAMTTERLREPDSKKWGAFVVFGVPSGRHL
jgi:CHAT domain-containing protein